MSGKRVDCHYKILGGDELTHTVHRHEPAVGLADNLDEEDPIDNDTMASPPIEIVHEDSSLLIVDKPSTLPIHPCGGYNFNSLFEILSHWKPQLYGSGKLFTVHRLDRLTSGLVLIAKSSALARSLGKCIMERDGCEKIYLVRVKGKFPLNLQATGFGKREEMLGVDEGGKSGHFGLISDSRHPWRFQYHPSKNSGGDLFNSEGRKLNANKRSRYIIPQPCLYGEFTSSFELSGASRTLNDFNSNTVRCGKHQYSQNLDFHDRVWSGGLQIPIVIGDSDNTSRKIKSKYKNEETRESYAALGYWITNGSDSVVENASLADLFNQCSNMSMEDLLSLATKSKENPTATSKNTINIETTRKSILWLNFACPCRVASHKNGTCEAGDFSHLSCSNNKNNSDNEEGDVAQLRKGIKPAQTSFTTLSYDESSDTSLVLAKPVTGRTHQIRLHFQQLGHPIANDHCYGGELWFGDKEGKEICIRSREWLDRLDQGEASTHGATNYCTEASAKGDSNGSNGAGIAPQNATVADVPATEAEIYHAAANRPREEGESILEFIEKTCVWCARCRGVAGLNEADSADLYAAGKNLNFDDDKKYRQLEQETAVFRRTLMEYLVRSQGIWLHAFQYSLKAKDENGRNKTLNFRTKIPSWAVLS